MDLAHTTLLGVIAGGTIVLGMPVGRLRRELPRLKLMLNAVAIGVLLFLFWDVLDHAWEPVDARLGAAHDGSGGLGPVFGYGLLFAGGLSAGLLGLVAYDRLRPVRPTRSGPGAMSVTEAATRARRTVTTSAARRTALLIAVGIGLHNFAEGLAIGQSAAGGEVALATLLVIGFALHNATEGFGIVAPLSGDVEADGTRRRPSWGYLLGLAAIGGGPTVLGTVLGHGWTSEPVSVLFLTLAAGSIVYVVCQLVGVAARARRTDLLALGVLLGLLAGFVTDAVVTAGGA